MTDITDTNKVKLRRWLLSDAPASAFQARAGRVYSGCLDFSNNRLAVLGLSIILLLILDRNFCPAHCSL